MKLPDFFNFEPLNRLRTKMGIADGQYGSFSVEVNPGCLTLEELDRLTSEGIEVYFDELTILADGTLALKDRRVLVYIRDVHDYGRQNWEPRCHLFNCATLVSMAQKGRFEDKYVAFDKEDPKFPIYVIRKSGDKQKEYRYLRVCQNCLDGLAFNGFSLQKMTKKERSRFVTEFTPNQFFNVYPRLLHAVKPKHDSDTAPLNDYPLNFEQISQRLRQENGWQCQKCGRNLSAQHLRKYLHVHHVNGNRSDNKRQNLRILCVACHADEPHHSHMRKSAAYTEFIKSCPARRAKQADILNVR
jgi:hypothetical protein